MLFRSAPDKTLLYFNRAIPMPSQGGLAGGPRNLIMGLEIVATRTVRVRAKIQNPTLISNELEFKLSLDETMTGQWRLPIILGDYMDGLRDPVPTEQSFNSSRISSATYLSVNDFEITQLCDSSSDPIDSINVGEELRIFGNHFPITSETKVPVFIVKQQDGHLLALKDITSLVELVSDEYMRVPSMPSPPTGINGDYFIVIGGLTPAELTAITDTRTAKPLTIVD